MNEQDLRTAAFKVRRCGDGYSLAINLPGIMDGLIGRFSKEEATFANEAFRKADLALLADRDRWRGVADGLAKVAHKHVARELDYGREYFHDDEALAAYDAAVAGQPPIPDVNAESEAAEIMQHEHEIITAVEERYAPLIAELLEACKDALECIADANPYRPVVSVLKAAIAHAEGKP